MAWQGIFPAVTTRFTEDDRLDTDEMARAWQRQITAGVDGLIVCGSLGEAMALEPDEKLASLRLAKGLAAGRPVLMTVCESSTRRACAAAEAAASDGADGLMVLPGVPYKSDPRETMQHYRTVARAAGLPVMLYINPIAYGVDITPAMLAEMTDEPLLVALKESSDDIRRVTDIVNLLGDRYAIFTGVDNLALESILMGAVGWVAGLVLAFPEETVAIDRLAKAGRIEEARRIYRWLKPLLDVDVSTKLVQNIKLVEALVTGSNDRCRAPRLPLVGAERAHIEALVRTALATRPELPAL